MARPSDEEIEERLSGLQGWERDGEAIRRQFELARKIDSVDRPPFATLARSADERRRRTSK